MPLQFLDKIIRAKHGFLKTCLVIGIYSLLQPNTNWGWVAFVWIFWTVPVVLWIFNIRKHGLLRGTRRWIHVIAKNYDDRLTIHPKKIVISFSKIENLFIGRWYRGIPKIIKTFLLPFWYGIPAYLIFLLFNTGEPTKYDTVCANILKNLFPSFDYEGYNPVSIVYSGGIMAICLLHFTLSLGNQILNKINRKISISLIYQG